jgi:DNA processing protein
MIDAPLHVTAQLRLAYVLSVGSGLSNKLAKRVLLESDIVPEAPEDLIKLIVQFGHAPPGDIGLHWKRFDKVVERHQREAVHMLAITDQRYPPSLRAIVDPPPILYLRGNLDLLGGLPGAAVVGTRKASTNGATIAYRISAYLSEHGFIVVSGLALGIDTAAHRGALSVHSPNIAVLAHGLHKYAPPSNTPLAEEILNAGGAVVSEHPLGQQPQPSFFVARNRIQIGLSAGSVIVEGEIKSGTMKQAEFCVREKRALFAVIPDENQQHSLGLTSGGPQSLVASGKARRLRGRQDYEDLLVRLHGVRQKLQNGADMRGIDRPLAFPQDHVNIPPVHD